MLRPVLSALVLVAAALSTIPGVAVDQVTSGAASPEPATPVLVAEVVQAAEPRGVADGLDMGRLGLALADLVGIRFPGDSLDLGRSRDRERRRLFRAR